MRIFIYDSTFEGLLTLVFDSYNQKIKPDKILSNKNLQDALWSDKIEIITDESKAERVWNGILKKISKEAAQMIYKVFLSELSGIELLIYKYIRKVFESPISIETNFGDECVMEMTKIYRKVIREAQRIPMFIRFQKTVDGFYFAVFDPKYNVLPLVISHFEKRYANQKWIIYDTNRNYGYFYDLENVSEIKLNSEKINLITGKIQKEATATDEDFFQKLWLMYYDSIFIPERKNPRLHKQLLPKRFWKYLPEKNRI